MLVLLQMPGFLCFSFTFFSIYSGIRLLISPKMVHIHWIIFRMPSITLVEIARDENWSKVNSWIKNFAMKFLWKNKIRPPQKYNLNKSKRDETNWNVCAYFFIRDDEKRAALEKKIVVLWLRIPRTVQWNGCCLAPCNLWMCLSNVYITCA